MRQKKENLYFTIFYPGLPVGSTLGEYERRDRASIAVAKDGEFVSLCGNRYGNEQSCAVFYSVEELQELRDCLDEAIDTFADAKAKRSTLRK